MNVLLPFKGLANAKSRWPDMPQKQELLLQLLETNLATVASVVGTERTYLVSPDREALARFGRYTGLEVNGEGLNRDLEQARRQIDLSQPLAVVLPDLPFLKVEDIKELVLAAQEAPVTICPDHRGVGTNALVLNPADCLSFSFEGESARRHWQRASDLGLSTSYLKRPGLAQDCDGPEDLERYLL